MSEKLGPLPDRTLAEIRNDFINQNRLSETGPDYWGSNWYEVRKLYTADDMRAYAAQEVAKEQERCAKLEAWLQWCLDNCDDSPEHNFGREATESIRALLAGEPAPTAAPQ